MDQSDPASTAQAVVAMDENGRITHFSSAAERLFDWTREAALGTTVWELLGPTEEAERRRRLLDSADEMVCGGRWAWTLDTDEILWSDGVYSVYGLEPGSITPTSEWVFAGIHPDDRERVIRNIDRMKETGELAPLEYRFIRADGTVRHINAVRGVAEERDGRPYRVVGWLRDVTEERRAEREIAAHVAVSEALAGWSAFEPGVQALLANLCHALEFEAAVLWLPDGGALVARGFWQSAAAHLGEFEQETRRARVPRGFGVPGLAWERGEPINLQQMAAGCSTRRGEVAERGGLRGRVAFPAQARHEVIAVVELATTEEAVLGERLMRSLEGIGYEIGQFLARRRGDLQPCLLTPRELEVLQLAAHGVAGPQIAERLVVSHATVRSHLEHIYAKLGVSGRAAAVAKALRLGLIE
jgi:PAS domain S-box-containing protein